MKKYLMPAILAILFTNSLSAFEVYGIKSGMTKEEYYAAVDCQAGVDKYNVGKTGKYDTKASLDWCEDSSLRDLPYFEVSHQKSKKLLYLNSLRLNQL